MSEILDQLTAQPSWQERYRMLLNLAEQLQPSMEIRREENFVAGCESPTWLSWRTLPSAELQFSADSESKIVKGLLVLLLAEINAKQAGEIRQLALDSLLKQAGLQRHLSASRSNGLYAVFRRVQMIAEKAR